MITEVVGVCERLQYGNWKDYREEFARLSPQLASIIDEVDPGDDCRIYLATYKYGEAVSNGSGFCLPGSDGVVSLSKLNNEISEDLGYACLPLTFVMENSAELYAADDSYVAPINIFFPGDLFGVYESLTALTNSTDIKSLWNINAGVNSVCLLGKASNVIKHRQLCMDYDFRLPAPKTLMEQRYTFREVGRKSDWRCKLLFFGGRWLSHAQDKAWMPFYHYLFKTAWHQLRNVRNESRFDSFWDSDRFSKYVNAAARRIMMIVGGYCPGMSVVNDCEWLLPSSFIESVYLDKYHLDYAPILMGPAFLGRGNYESRTVYFSSNYNTLCLNDSKGYDRNANVGFKELERLSALFSGIDGFTRDSINEGLVGHDVNLEGNEILIRFFYGGTASTSGSLFLDSHSLSAYDRKVNTLMHGRFSGYSLPALATFLRSCVQISVR